MSGRSTVIALFVVAALYDGVLGLAFLLAPESLFERFQVTPPNHYGYVKFPAAILIVFGLMFAAVARNPEGNRNLIPYGMLLKVSYCATVFGYWFSQGIPGMWKPFAVADLLFLILFGWAYGLVASGGSGVSLERSAGDHGYMGEAHSGDGEVRT